MMVIERAGMAKLWALTMVAVTETAVLPNSPPPNRSLTTGPARSHRAIQLAVPMDRLRKMDSAAFFLPFSGPWKLPVRRARER